MVSSELKSGLMKRLELEDQRRNIIGAINKCNEEYNLTYIQPQDFLSLNSWCEANKINHDDRQDIIKECFDKNLDLCFSFYHRKNNARAIYDETRKIAFNNILDYPDRINTMFIQGGFSNYFNSGELEIIHRTHKKDLLKKSSRGVNTIYNYCKFFNVVLEEDEKDVLIKRIIGRKKTGMAKTLINSNRFNLSEDQKDTLNGLLVYDKMQGNL